MRENRPYGDGGAFAGIRSLTPTLALVAVVAASARSASPSPPATPQQAASAQRPPSKPGVQSSTQAAEGANVDELYRTERLRDPFAPPGAGGSSAPAAKSNEPEAFNIHNLSLKGVMKDKSGDYAILVSKDGATYILKKGLLFDFKNKPVPGVAGKAFPAQKKVLLQTPDKDVQTLIIGEEEKEGI